MIHITELRLPLEHTEDALRTAVIERLGITDAQLLSFDIFKRSYDARKKNALTFIYTVDAQVTEPETLLKKFRGDPHIKPTPDTDYTFVVRAGQDTQRHRPRPVVIGFGPCGIFAALLLAQMGLKPIVLERGKAVRERTQDTWKLWRKNILNPESNVQCGEGGAGTADA